MATRDEILESIANMTVMEVADLIKAMEEKFGVTAAAAAVAVAAGPAAAAEEVEEKTEFDVILKSFDAAEKSAQSLVSRKPKSLLRLVERSRRESPRLMPLLSRRSLRLQAA